MKAQINRSCALAISANAFYNERDFKVCDSIQNIFELIRNKSKGALL